MATLYEYLTYVAGGAVPTVWTPTTFANDGGAFDHTTHLNGGGPNTGVGGSDWQTSFGLPLTGVIKLRVTPDSPVVASQATFSAMIGKNVADSGTVTGSWVLEGVIASVLTELDSGAFLGANVFLDQTANFDTATISQFVLTVNITRVTTGSPQVFGDIFDFRILGTACIVPGPPQGFNVVMAREPGGTAKATLSWLDSIQGDLPITYLADQVNAGSANIQVGQKVSGVDIPPYIVEVTGLNQDQEYCFVIFPQNDCGIGTSTGQVCASIDSVANPPNNFEGVEECEGNQTTLTWDLPVEPPDVTGFRIRRNGVLVATLGPTIQEWVDTSPGIGVTNMYSIVAYNEAGESPPATLTRIACEWEACVDEPAAGNWAVIE